MPKHGWKRTAFKALKVFLCSVALIILVLIVLLVGFFVYTGRQELQGDLYEYEQHSPDGNLKAVLAMYSGGIPPENFYGLFIFPATADDSSVWEAIEDIDDACVFDMKSFPDFYWKGNRRLALEKQFKYTKVQENPCRPVGGGDYGPVEIFFEIEK